MSDDPRDANERRDANDPFIRLARESGNRLGELGVRPDDEAWIGLHAESIASLVVAHRRRSAFLRLRLRRFWLYRLARRAARTAR